MTAHFETLAAKGSETTAAKEVVELQLKRQVSEIKNDILTCHALQTELTELRSSKAALEERCTLKDASVTSLEEQVAELREKENTSFEKLSQAELEVKRLKLATENNQHTTARLRELELQVADTNERLITAKEELRTEKEKVATLEESEATLKERVEDLEQQPANDPKEQVDIESIKAEAQRLVSPSLRQVADPH